jgi:hypothetical protein
LSEYLRKAALSRYVHIGACEKDKETKCLKVEPQGQYYGCFTYYFYHAIKNRQREPFSTYRDLIENKVKPKLQENMASPPTIHGPLADTPFLKSATRSFEIHFTNNAWVLNAGYLHGIIPSDQYSKTILQLEDGTMVSISAVFETYSLIEGIVEANMGKVFKALVNQMAIPRIKMAFASMNHPQSEMGIKNALAEQPSIFINFTDDVSAAAYLIHADQNHYWITEPDQLDTPLFQKLPITSAGSTLELLNRLDKVAQWKNTLELNNPQSTIKSSEIQLRLFKNTEPGNIEDNAAVQELIYWEQNHFVYEKVLLEWQPPAFQLSITNHSDRPIWIQVLNLGSDFSIKNRLLKSLLLKPGRTEYLADVFEGHPYRCIPLTIPQAYLKLGIQYWTEYILVLASTQPINTDALNQIGIPPEPHPQQKRDYGQKPHLNLPDWTAFKVKLTLEYPPNSTT